MIRQVEYFEKPGKGTPTDAWTSYPGSLQKDAPMLS